MENTAQPLNLNEHPDVMQVILEAVLGMVMGGITNAYSTAHLILKVAQIMGV